MASRIDRLKERLSHFVKESSFNNSLKIPSRLLQGFKIEHVAIAIQDLLTEKHSVKLQFDTYLQNGDDYTFVYRLL